MSVSIWEPFKFLFDRRTVPGAHTVAATTRQLSTQMQIIQDDLMGMVVCSCYVASYLWVNRLKSLKLMFETEPLYFLITFLSL